MTPAELTVFVVDDDASVRRSLVRLLRAAGHRVEAFATARDFLMRGEHGLRGCLLLDVRMPGMTGPELQQALGALGRDVPIVFITGHGDVPMAAQAIEAGAADFLTKPVDDDVLLAAVARALDRAGGRSAEDGGAVDHRVDSAPLPED